jgi:hypothetical protein
MHSIAKVFTAFAVWFYHSTAYSQADDSISSADTKRIINFLASDSLGGRGNFTPELTKAANFIANEFNRYGLEVFPGYNTFILPFVPERGFNVQLSGNLNWNGRILKRDSYDVLISTPDFTDKGLKEFRVIKLDNEVEDSLLFRLWQQKGNVLFWKSCKNDSCKAVLPENVLLPEGSPACNIILSTERDEPKEISYVLDKVYRENVLVNVAGIIPGKSLSNEIVIFSAHYDHVGRSDETGGDNIYNGANDNASGTTAMLMLARYYAMRNNNERTLVFCAFAGEELGLFGSYAFVKLIKPESVMAVINLEMLGRTTGNSFFLTGEKLSDLKKIFERNLKGGKFKISPEQGENADMFNRSDNLPFALLGIPAHTITTSDDTDDVCYHKPCDDARRILFENMTRVIKAISKASESIIMGKDTPSRINPKNIKGVF